MTIPNSKTTDEVFDIAILQEHKYNKLISFEENDIVLSAYTKALTTDYKLLKTNEAIKALGLNSQKELSRLITLHEISTIRIAGHTRVPSWSVFLYSHKRAFKLNEDDRNALIENHEDDDYDESFDDDFWDDIYYEDAYELFVDDFYEAASIFFYNTSADNNYYTIYDLFRILRLPPNIIFKLLGNNYIKTIFYNGQICFCPSEVHRFLNDLEYNNNLIL